MCTSENDIHSGLNRDNQRPEKNRTHFSLNLTSRLGNTKIESKRNPSLRIGLSHYETFFGKNITRHFDENCI